MKKYKFTVIGGDMRSCAAASYINEKGFVTDTFLLDNAICVSDALKKEIFPISDCYILGLPASADGEFINAPLSDRSLSVSDFFKLTPKHSKIFGGLFCEEFYSFAKQKDITIFDYYKEESLQIRNAVPTAEGALEIAMHELPITISGTKSLIIGYGRITRVLAPMLSALGSDVYVASRSSDGRAFSDVSGFHGVDTEKLCDIVGKFDLIYNTAPAPVITDEILRAVKMNVLIIDLASRPGGVDMDSASQLGVEVIWALSLPGKCAPLSAGQIIGDTILNILN